MTSEAPLFAQGPLPVIGIAGDYCSGKSALAAVFAERGWVHIEVDALGHEALEQQQEQILAAFASDISSDSFSGSSSGSDSGILNPQTGNIDRKKLGRLVFADSSKLARLENLLHPIMVRRVREIVEGHQHGRGQLASPRGILINAAILYKMGLDSLCDLVLWIQSPLLLRLVRAKRRDGMSLKEILNRFVIQKTSFPQLVHSNTDVYRVDNIFMGRTVRRIEQILRVRIWNRIKPTSLSW